MPKKKKTEENNGAFKKGVVFAKELVSPQRLKRTGKYKCCR